VVHKNFTFQVPFTITTLGDSSLMKIEMHLIHNSDFSVVFAFLFTYLCGAISFAILISSLVTRRKSIELYDEFIYRVNLIKKFVQFSAFASTMISSILFLASCAPGIALLYTYSRSRGTKMLACLGLNSGLFFGIQIMLFFIDKGDGIQWSNFASGIDASDPMALIDVMGMFIVDAIVYFILAIYVEGVWPGEFGTPLPWYFPFTVSQSYLATGNWQYHILEEKLWEWEPIFILFSQKWYWLGRPRDELKSGWDAEKELASRDDKYFETEPTGTVGVSIQSLSKRFGKKLAVNNLSLNIYEDQITALLGVCGKLLSQMNTSFENLIHWNELFYFTAQWCR